MVVKTNNINLNTKGNTDILDITDDVSRTVVESGLSNGVVTVFSVCNKHILFSKSCP